jgi:hypothetical protein
MPFAVRFLPAVVLCTMLPALAAEQPTLLGASKEWVAYQATTPDGKVCYALGKPGAILPKKAARDPIYFIVSTWPSRKVQDELEVVPGYLYKENEPVFAEVGNHKTEFVSRNDGGSGAAWVKEPADEAALVAAMRGGSSLRVTGVSKRGTKTEDTYSLSGLTTALDRTHEACKK